MANSVFFPSLRILLISPSVPPISLGLFLNLSLGLFDFNFFNHYNYLILIIKKAINNWLIQEKFLPKYFPMYFSGKALIKPSHLIMNTLRLIKEINLLVNLIVLTSLRRNGQIEAALSKFIKKPIKRIFLIKYLLKILLLKYSFRIS